jgi:hypothetical protein
MVEMTGGCLCGQVRYSANADPAFVGVCHCKNCQKQTGTAFSVLVGIPKSAMSVQGRVKTFHDTGDSGQPVERNFCPECGSPIFSDVAVMPGVALSKRARWMTRVGSILKCMSIATARSTGLPSPKAVRDSRKCPRRPLSSKGGDLARGGEHGAPRRSGQEG